MNASKRRTEASEVSTPTTTRDAIQLPCAYLESIQLRPSSYRRRGGLRHLPETLARLPCVSCFDVLLRGLHQVVGLSVQRQAVNPPLDAVRLTPALADRIASQLCESIVRVNVTLADVRELPR